MAYTVGLSGRWIPTHVDDDAVDMNGAQGSTLDPTHLNDETVEMDGAPGFPSPIEVMLDALRFLRGRLQDSESTQT